MHMRTHFMPSLFTFPPRGNPCVQLLPQTLWKLTQQPAPSYLANQPSSYVFFNHMILVMLCKAGQGSILPGAAQHPSLFQKKANSTEVMIKTGCSFYNAPKFVKHFMILCQVIALYE